MLSLPLESPQNWRGGTCTCSTRQVAPDNQPAAQRAGRSLEAPRALTAFLRPPKVPRHAGFPRGAMEFFRLEH